MATMVSLSMLVGVVMRFYQVIALRFLVVVKGAFLEGFVHFKGANSW
jgi:hypothetical protein